MIFKRFKDVDPKWKAYALAGCICVLFFVCITHLNPIFTVIGNFLYLFRPVIIGAIIAYILFPLAAFFSQKVFCKIKKTKLRWVLSVVVTLILVFALLSILLATLVPQLIDSIESLIDNISLYVDNLVSFAETVQGPAKEVVDQITEFISGAEGPISRVSKLIAGNLSNIIKTTSDIGSSAMNTGIGVIIAIYLLLAKDSIGSAFKRFFKLVLQPMSYRSAGVIFSKFNAIFSKYIICELLDALIVGGLTFLFMTILNMPNSLVISVLVGVTNLVPTFGPIVGAVVGAILLLLVHPGSVIPFLIFTMALQTADGYLVKPKLFGDALNVPGVLILIAIIVFGRLWGIVGMLIAIPAAAIIVYIYSEILLPKLEEKRLQKNISDN